MKEVTFLISIALLAAVAACGQSTGKDSLVERVGDTGFVRVEVESFQSLDARQQQLAYWLTQAAIALDPIAYDQFSRFGLRQKRLLEGIVAHSNGVDPSLDAEIAEFTKLFWANRGNHNQLTSQKFLPRFSFEELQRAALAARQNGAFAAPCADLPPLATAAELNRELAALRASLFDPNFEPMLTAKPSSRPGHHPGQLKHLLRRRHARRPERFSRSLSAQLTGRQRQRRQAPRGGLSRRHSGRQDSSGALRHFPQTRQRVFCQGPAIRGARAGSGDRRPHPLLSNRRSR